MKQFATKLLPLLACLALTLSACGASGAGTSQPLSQPVSETPVSSTRSDTSETDTTPEPETPTQPEPDTTTELSQLPAYSGDAYVAVNANQPYFTQADYTTEAFETYSELDGQGRCGVAYANICLELMPTEERGEIGQIKPTGWHTVKYDCVDGKYLYNRCHLIGFQLAGENANEKNLITGTRYLNIQGMLPFENLVDDYVEETGNHVLYRVTPIFEGDNPVASGVLMEGWSVEDEGEGVCFCVYAYNVQPGVDIDYATGESALSGEVPESQTEEETATDSTESAGEMEYVLNTSSHKFHLPNCASVGQMSEANKQSYTGSREDLIAQGYSPCGNCNP